MLAATAASMPAKTAATRDGAKHEPSQEPCARRALIRPATGALDDGFVGVEIKLNVATHNTIVLEAWVRRCLLGMQQL